MTKPADSDQIAKARRERAQQFCLQMQKDAGINKPHPTNFPPIRDSHELFNAMAAFAASERQAVIEECAKKLDNMAAQANKIGNKIFETQWIRDYNIVKASTLTEAAAAIRSME